jgi:hypothetical protein
LAAFCVKLESPASRQLVEVELSKGTWVDPDPEPGMPVRLRLGGFMVFRTSSDLQEPEERIAELSQTA